MRKRRTIHLLIAAVIAVGLDLHAPSTAAAQTKSLVKVAVGYGSTDGAIAPLWFAKEAKLFEKRGLDVQLVGMGTGSVSLRALIATIKAVVFEVYVQGPERVERLMYVHQLVESLKRDNPPAKRAVAR